MSKTRSILVFLVLLMSSAWALGQNYSFIRLSPGSGFPSKVNSILVEKEGFAWLGSDNGLYILAGNNNVFQFSTGDKVHRIISDSHNVVWVLTDKGISGLKTELHFDRREAVPGPEGVVAYSAVAAGDCVYFGCRNAIWKYDYADESFSEALALGQDSQFVIEYILQARSNDGRDLLVFNRDGGHVIFDTVTGLTREADTAASKDFYAPFIDSFGQLWLSEFNEGVFCFSPDGSVIRHLTTENSDLVSNNVLCFAECEGGIWMGTEGAGVSILDLSTGSISNLVHDTADPYSIPSGTVTSMVCDHNGHIWCCTPRGGAFVVTQPAIRSYHIANQIQYSSYEGINVLFSDPKSDIIWVGTNGTGLISFDPATGKFREYPSTRGLNVFSICRYNDRMLALSCPGTGILGFNTADGTVETFANLLGVNDSQASRLDGISLGNDYRGRSLVFADSIFRYDSDYNRSDRIDISGADIHGSLRPVYDSQCRYLVDDDQFFRWDETRADKLELICPDAEGNTFYSATMDKVGNIWALTGDRLCMLDTSTGELKYMDYRFETLATLIMCDRIGRLWVGTRNKLYVFTPDLDGVLALSEVNGVYPNDYSALAKMTASNGDIYLGGRDGMLRINASFQLPRYKDPEFVVYGVTVDDDTIATPDNFSVRGIHSDITIHMFAKTRDILQSTVYRIRCVNSRGRVLEKETPDPVFNFHRLAPGRYTLYVACTNMDGRWTDFNEIGRFRVRTIYYKSFWFLAICSLLAICLYILIYFGVIRRNRKKRDQQREMEEERYNFLVNVNHELRTPLTLVSGPIARLLKNENLDEKTHKQLLRINQQTEKMSKLLDTVLTTTSLQEKGIVTNKQPVNLNDWVKQKTSEFHDEARSLNMRLIHRLDPSIGMVEMDENLCSIVFYNVITNAFKHNVPGHHITVWTKFLPDEKAVQIGIKDHGSGLPNVDVTKLFEKYFKTTEDRSGFGMGLTFAKSIVEAHGGSIGAYNNKKENGATFWFKLPAEENTGRSETQILESVKAKARQVESKALKDKTILFVDDDSDLRDFMSEELEEVCKKVLLAADADETLRLLSNNEVDAIIADIMMPGMDGLDLCSAIKRNIHFKHIPVILLTSRNDELTRAIGISVKADYFLPKPFDMDSLISILEFKTNQ